MTWPRYFSYRATSAEFIWELPGTWSIRSLKSLAAIPVANGVGEPGAFDNPEWPRYVRITDIASARSLRTDTFASLPPETAADAELLIGDLLLAAVGASFGKSYLHKQNIGPACFAGFMVRFRCGKDVLPEYASYWTESAQYWGQVQSRVVQSTIQNFSASRYGALWVPLPPIADQRAIVSFLDRETAKIDALIAEQERLIALLQEKRQAVISHAVTKGLDPNVPMKESGDNWLGAVPSHWEMVSLKQIAEIKPSGLWGDEPSLDLQVRPVATTAHINRDGQFLVEEMPLRGFTNEELSEYECRPGDIVVVKSSGSATNIVSGKSGLVLPQTPKLVFSNFLMLVRPDPSRVFPEFVSHFLRSNLTRQRIELMCSTTTYPNLKVPEYASALIPLPPLAEQRQLLQLLDASLSGISESIGASERCMELLSERRRALITAAVTGQIDVRGLMEAE